MSRWKELPTELDPRVRQLVVRLRRLKDHSGLSLRQLAAKTGYSAKSWERYLGGRSLPPGEAVEAMARIGGDDPARLLALHEVAAERWAAARESRSTRAAPEETRSRGGPPRVAVVAGSVAVVLAVSSAILLAVRLGDGSGGRERGGTAATHVVQSTSTSASTSSASRTPVTYTCRVQRVDGRWQAGNSRTEDAVLAYGHAGPEVAEAQCLLRRAGVSPGEVDGIYGPLTQRAVKRVQKRAGLVVDGIIGPHTWKALRETAPR
ncbi:peptidoglycan-binding protein [Streptomyces sp. NPDC052309]|uniref:peptidoglycan-binding protein n=1 Tax=Streptomyces sp. NPDC052309 TaxID=3155421 RepID=UPI003444644E